MQTSTSSTMRIAMAVAVTASGVMLTPLLVFKGKPGGRIEREIVVYTTEGLFAVQQKAWMDERMMLDWFDRILKPYVATAPRGIHPFLLDSYRCHLMGSVVKAPQTMCSSHERPRPPSSIRTISTRGSLGWRDIDKAAIPPSSVER